MANQKDLVVKMTINSQDFDNGLKNAKASMNKFNADSKGMGASFKNVIGGMTKAFGALGIAVSGAQMFKTFISSTQTMGDQWENTMIAAKTSFQTFATSVISGNNDIIRNFRSLISAAAEFADAQDALGSAKISNRYARLTYLNPFNQALANASEPGISKEQKQAYIEEARGYYNQYANNVKVVQAAAQREVIAWLNKELPGYNFNATNVKPALDNLYLNLINGILDPVTKRYKEVTSKNFWKGDALHNSAQSRISGGEAIMLGEGYSRQQIAMARLISKQLEIPDDRLNQNLDVLETEVNATAELIQLQKRINRAMGAGGGGTTELTTPTSSSTTPTMTTDQIIEYLSKKLQNELLAGDKAKDSLIVDIEVIDDDIIENETEDLVQRFKDAQEQAALLAKTTQMAFMAASNLAVAFNAFGDVSDSTLGKVSKGLGSVITQVVATIQALMALTGAETVEGVAQVFSEQRGDVWVKLAAAGIALAGIMGIIAAAKNSFAGSYAEGGVVGGSSYTGDRLWARVNSGEMILNQKQQAALIGNSGQVKFVIEGSQLKGVLENYETIENI